MQSEQLPGVVQNWSTLQCSKQNTEQCGYDHAPLTRGRMRAQFPLPHGPPPPQRHGNFTSGKWWVGENMPACVHVIVFALLSLAAVGKVSKPRRGHPLVESSCLRLTLW